MKLFILGLLAAPIIYVVVGLLGYYIGRFIWEHRPKDGPEGATGWWASFSTFDKKFIDEK